LAPTEFLKILFAKAINAFRPCGTALTMPTIYTAHWVLPIATPPIENGAVAIENSEIIAVGPRDSLVARFPDSEIEEFGQAAILPGLVNAHSHLELTVMRGFLEREERDFFAWLRKLTAARMTMSPDDLIVSATCGAIEAARAGVTCVADSSSAGKQTIKALRNVGLRGIVYQESFGPDPALASEHLGQLRDQIGEMRIHENQLARVGVSPHSPYTVSALQIELISRLAVEENLPLMMHAAESQAEKLLLLEGSGPFAEGLKKRGIEWQTPGLSTIKYLRQHGVLETKPLFAHCINVDETDLETIKQNHAGIAHCPKSNAKLGHGRAPFARFIANKINVGLGSDSVASNNTCDILEEARFATLLARLPCSADDTFDVRPAEQALFAATLGGARALGLDHRIGSLAEGMQADITVVSLGRAHQEPVSDPANGLVFSSSGGDVVLTVVAGVKIFSDGHVTLTAEAETQRRLKEIRQRLDGIA
jgi:cytosine/adenosine deaminase-related metal-dependent hydrolase